MTTLYTVFLDNGEDFFIIDVPPSSGNDPKWFTATVYDEARGRYREAGSMGFNRDHIAYYDILLEQEIVPNRE